MKVNHNPNYSVIEGSNKPRILEKYLSSHSEIGEVSLIGFIKNLELENHRQEFFSKIDKFLDTNHQAFNPLQDHLSLSEMVKKK